MKTLAIAFAILAGSLAAAPAVESVSMKPEAAATWLAATPGARILDVRTQEEFATDHLAKAVLIPWTDKDFAARAAKELDSGKPVLVYCRSGRRSAEAAAALVKLGFADVRSLDGGILAWEKAGQPIVKPALPEGDSSK
jgi:rhodanese-related sulfurtransferase